MIITLVRHGESMSNAKQILASEHDSKNGLTDEGVNQIEIVAKDITGDVDAIYTSPYLRCRLSAAVFARCRMEEISPIVDDRLRGVDYGKYTDVKDHPMVGAVALRQIGGDLDARFGDYGESKREILSRLYSFLIDQFGIYKPDNQLVAFSHGRAISMLEKSVHNIKNLDAERIHTGNGVVKRLQFDPNDLYDLIDEYNHINGRG